MSLKNTFEDDGAPLNAFSRIVFCTCPKCKSVLIVKGKFRYLSSVETAHASCTGCAFQKTFSDNSWYGPVIGYGRKRCSHCGGKWLTVLRHENIARNLPDTLPVLCSHCAHSSELALEWSPEKHSDKPIDPYFGFPLHLQTRWGNNVLWAYNPEHIRRLKSYVAATQRKGQKGKWSMVARLPRWIKEAGARDKVLKCLERLERKAL